MNITETHSIRTILDAASEGRGVVADGACEPEHATAGGGNSSPDDSTSWSSLARSRPR